MLLAGLLAGEADGVRPRGGLLLAGNQAAAAGFLVGVDFAGC